MIETDYAIIGSGIAGLSFAIEMAENYPDRSILIITKNTIVESNTKYAQGGIAIVQDSTDSFKSHIEDTLKAAGGLCDLEVVEKVVKEGPGRLKKLLQWGTNFDTETNGTFKLGKEGGHKSHRIIHHKDSTGLAIEKSLITKLNSFKNIRVLTHCFVVDLITDSDADSPNKLECYGIKVLETRTGRLKLIKAKATILASGGIGQVYGQTTNPEVATGDGIAMAYRANALIKEMEFIQFHPTLLYNKEKSSFLISEAVRGFGAFLRNKKGERFMLNYDSRAELASRDIVSRAIFTELQKSKEDYVFLDCTHLNIKKFKEEFPIINAQCELEAIDISKDFIPVVPAAHYVCGGIAVNSNAETNIINLFACGECARTGLHGANRLASNSLLEALVYAHNCYVYLASKSLKKEAVNKEELKVLDIEKVLTKQNLPVKERKLIEELKQELQSLMSRYAGIVRTYPDLEKCRIKLAEMQVKVAKLYRNNSLDVPLLELRNMIVVAELIVSHSIERTENIGGYYNEAL